MASYDEARAALRDLWAGELAELDQQEAEAARRVSEARERVGGLQRRIIGCEERLRLLAGELDYQPTLLARAQLEDDQAEVLALQGRHAALKEEISAVRAEKGHAEEELNALGGERHARRVRRENMTVQLRSDFRKGIELEFAALREDLEDAYARATGKRRSWRERARAEERAGREHAAGVESRRALGMPS